MPRGGARPGAGRPVGSRDVVPRAARSYEQLKSLSPEFNTSEFFVTNDERVFGGNAVDLMKSIHKAEQLPVRVRLYAASKAAEFELPSGSGYSKLGLANSAPYSRGRSWPLRPPWHPPNRPVRAPRRNHSRIVVRIAQNFHRPVPHRALVQLANLAT